MEYMRLPEGTEELEIDGENWIRGRLCVVRYGVTRSQRLRGRRKGSTPLNGRRLAYQQFRLGRHLVWFYLEREIVAIATAWATDIHVIEDDSGRWLWERLVAGRLQIGIKTVQCDQWPLPGGRSFVPRSRYERVWGGDGRAQRYKRRFLLEEDVRDYERLIQETVASCPRDANWLPLAEAERKFNVSRSQIDCWSRCRQWKLEGRKLRREEFPSRRPRWGSGRPELTWHYFAPDLGILTDPSWPDYPVYRDADGEWLPAQSARKAYGFNKTTLGRWREKGCPRLGGRNLRAQRVRFCLTGASDGKAWVYHDDDLKQIHKARKNPPPAT